MTRPSIVSRRIGGGGLLLGLIAAVLLAAAAPATALSFAEPKRFPAGHAPTALRLADVDDDGALDIVTANTGGGTVSVLPGRGDGRFLPRLTSATGAHPVDLALADFNDDGALDVATCGRDTGAVSVVFGDGRGRFGPLVSYPLEPSLHAVIAADINGDGHPDIIAAQSPTFADGALRLLYNDGTGGFAAGPTLATGHGCYDVAAGDFNGDGHTDLATVFTDDLDGTVGVLLGDGSGGFAPLRRFGTYLEPVALTVGDLNGDGHEDIVSAQRLEGDGEIGLLLGDGAGDFTTPSGGDVRTAQELLELTLADVNVDGRQDVLSPMGSRLVVLRGNGHGGFLPPMHFVVGGQPADVSGADVNGDGRQDLLFADPHGNAVGVLLNGPHALPRLDRLTPASGRAGSPVTLTGGHFGVPRGAGVVTFAGRPAASYLLWTAKKIRVRVPADVPEGLLHVRVSTVAGTSAALHFLRR